MSWFKVNIKINTNIRIGSVEIEQAKLVEIVYEMTEVWEMLSQLKE